MRIGNGPRLVIARPGTPRRRGWYGRYIYRGETYDEWRQQERARLHTMRPTVAGDVKPQATTLVGLKPGEHYRVVGEHGRAAGPRLVKRAGDNRRISVRRVDRQPETIHSQLSRMLKRAHKDAMKEDRP